MLTSSGVRVGAVGRAVALAVGVVVGSNGCRADSGGGRSATSDGGRSPDRKLDDDSSYELQSLLRPLRRRCSGSDSAGSTLIARWTIRGNGQTANVFVDAPPSEAAQAKCIREV